MRAKKFVGPALVQYCEELVEKASSDITMPLLCEALAVAEAARKEREYKTAATALLLVARTYESRGANLIAAKYHALSQSMLAKESPASKAVRPAADLQEKLMTVLRDGPRNKYELMELLYEGQPLSEVLEKRFKHTLHRARKAYPGAICFWNGRYFLAEHYFFRVNTGRRA